MKRFLGAVLIACVLFLSVAAQARYDGPTPVDTWVRYGDRLAGQDLYGPNDRDGTLAVRVRAGSTHHVKWWVKNLGGKKPNLDYVTFSGCDNARGFRFRYIAPDGRDVTYKVKHRRYVVQHVLWGEDASVKVFIRATRPGREYVCELTGGGNGRTDTVNVRIHS